MSYTKLPIISNKHVQLNATGKQYSLLLTLGTRDPPIADKIHRVTGAQSSKS